MDKRVEITVHIKETHSCGQLIEQVAHMGADEAFSLTFHQDAVDAGGMTPKGYWIPPTFARPQITLSGHYSKVEVTGMELKEHQLRCVKCGADILFPEGEA